MKAIKLPSSEDFIMWPDESINRPNLINLLSEAYSKNLSINNRLIITYQKIRNPKLNWDRIENPQDDHYINTRRIFSYEELNNFYRTLEGVVKDYSPEVELERSDFVTSAHRSMSSNNLLRCITPRDVFC